MPRFAASIAIAVFLAGCGAESGGSGEAAAPSSDKESKPAETPAAPTPERGLESMLVADAATLPLCDAAAEGRLVYVQADAAFMACAAGHWAAISIKGDKGDAGVAGAAGAKGDQGAQGAQGAQGSGLKISAQYNCAGTTADLDTASDTTTKGLNAEVLRFSNGDFLFSCMDRQTDSTFTYADSSNDVVLYQATSNGVVAGAISCVSFYATATFTIATEKLAWKQNGGGLPVQVACTKFGAP